MSTITFDTWSPTTTYTNSFDHEGIAKVHFNVDQLGFQVNDTMNVATVDDNGSGDLDINYITAMQSTDNQVAANGGTEAAGSVRIAGKDAQDIASELYLEIIDYNGTVNDCPQVNGCVVGYLT